MEQHRRSQEIPDFATHYYLPDRRPFLNLSQLPAVELDAVLQDLQHRHAEGAHQRVFGPRYMELRRLTEAKIYDLFVQAGGKPQRAAPHYFVLGASDWYRGLARGTKEAVIDLSELPAEVTSFTYPDSFTAMGLGPQFGLPYEPRPYHQRVFRLEQLPDIVDRYGLPADEPDVTYEGYQHRPFEKYIEIQLWSDEPVRSFLGSL